jgi:hypothetical protein
MCMIISSGRFIRDIRMRTPKIKDFLYLTCYESNIHYGLGVYTQGEGLVGQGRKVADDEARRMRIQRPIGAERRDTPRVVIQKRLMRHVEDITFPTGRLKSLGGQVFWRISGGIPGSSGVGTATPSFLFSCRTTRSELPSFRSTDSQLAPALVIGGS